MENTQNFINNLVAYEIIFGAIRRISNNNLWIFYEAIAY